MASDNTEKNNDDQQLVHGNHPWNKEFHIAPMLDVSKPEFLNFMRILTKRAILWTEMVVDETLYYSDDCDSHLAHEPNLNPIVCQIGGRTTKYCAKATEMIVSKYNYDEVNLNIDCPSGRVSGKRKFGAILMHDKETAFAMVNAMKENNSNIRVPISVKTRVGIELDDGSVFDTADHLFEFIGELRNRGCRRFVIHARKCVIGGLSPAQNRLVPPLNYPRVYELCHRFPDCDFILNGGIPGLKVAREILSRKSISEIKNNYHNVPCSICNVANGSCTRYPGETPANLRGVMLGRAAIDSPAMFWDVDRYFYGEPTNSTKNRKEVLLKYCDYLDRIYPRRCCDNDDRITSSMFEPTISRNGEAGCDICRAFCKHVNGVSLSNDEVRACDRNVENKESRKIKITSRVIDRSLKPVLNIFFGLRHSKTFRRECEKLSRDKVIRNCGPSYILKLAMSVMPEEILTQPFQKTEDIDDKFLPLHHVNQAFSSFIKNSCG